MWAELQACGFIGWKIRVLEAKEISELIGGGPPHTTMLSECWPAAGCMLALSLSLSLALAIALTIALTLTIAI